MKMLELREEVTASGRIFPALMYGTLSNGLNIISTPLRCMAVIWGAAPMQGGAVMLAQVLEHLAG